MSHLIIKSVASMSLDIYKDNIFFIRCNLAFFSSASTRKIVQNLTLAFLIT